MLPVQNAETTKALVASLGLKGEYKLEIDQVMVPVQIAGDLCGSPYGTIVPVIGPRRQAGVAAVFSAISIEPAQGSILVVDRINIENDSGSDMEVECRYMTGAQVASVTTVASAVAINGNSLFNADGTVPRSGALVRSLTDAALTGDVVDRIGILDNTSGQFVFPSGIALYGDDAFGPGAIAVWGNVLQEPITGTFYARQFLNKG